MFCKQCGNSIKDGAAFCGNCGWAVPVTEVQAVVMPIGKQCASCGTALKDEAMFCPKCGQAVTAVSDTLSSQVIMEQKTKPAEKNKKHRKTAFKVVVVLASLVVIFFIAVIISVIEPAAKKPQANNNQPGINSSNTQQNQPKNANPSNSSTTRKLSNTTWYSSGSIGVPPATLYFGNDNFRLVQNHNGWSAEGTFTVSGDTVYLSSPDLNQQQRSGTIIGKSLSLYYWTFTRR